MRPPAGTRMRTRAPSLGSCAQQLGRRAEKRQFGLQQAPTLRLSPMRTSAYSQSSLLGKVCRWKSERAVDRSSPREGGSPVDRLSLQRDPSDYRSPPPSMTQYSDPHITFAQPSPLPRRGFRCGVFLFLPCLANEHKGGLAAFTPSTQFRRLMVLRTRGW